MSGIAGFVTADGAPPHAKMLDDLFAGIAHRGRDGEGRYVKGGVGLVHARLAIVDIKGGRQPFQGPNGTALVADGEIYNSPDLRREFPHVQFATNSDCEVPLYVYERDKVEFARALRGMYAMALYEPADSTLLLARDAFGIKPLYYTETAQGLAFASEAQTLLRARLAAPGVRSEAVAELLQLQFTTGRETIYPGIKRVLPGETLVVRRGKVVARHRMPSPIEGQPERISEGEALERLSAALADSVAAHRRTDVPLGVFLSGGIDSSAVLSVAARQSDKPVRAYTAYYPGADVGEDRDYAAQIASALGADHVMVPIRAEQFWSRLPAIVAAVGDPAADYAIVATYLLAEEAAKDVKVVLSGEGGDELFGGYGRYRSVVRPLWLGGRAMRAKGQLDGLGVLRHEGPAWRDGIVAVERRLADVPGTRLQRAQALDCADWLPNDQLIKLDRCLLAHAVEGRVPLLDPAVAAVAYRLPDELKISRGVGKYLLRKWLDAQLPVANAFGRKRAPTVPVAEWIAVRGAALGPLVAKVAGVEQVCIAERVEGLFRSAGRARDKHAIMGAWLLLFYALWYRIHIEGVASDGDVMATLSARA
jgi:asparagine synthase (glutamine-hydrolysing)